MGTTSEELKKLYAKLGGKDPKVAGFSAPGEILNAINEIPLPTEYELPTVTTEDAGDVLVVNEEGKWDKGEAGSGVIPNPEGEATVDLTKLGIDDTVYGIPKDVVIIKANNTYGATFYFENGKTQKDICDIVLSGKPVILLLYSNNTYAFTFISSARTGGGIRFMGETTHTDSTHMIDTLYLVCSFNSSDKYVNVSSGRSSGVPMINGSSDNGKILQVVGGAWTKSDPPASLPEVTTDDNGNVLTVVNGAWGKAAPSGACVVYNVGNYNPNVAVLNQEDSQQLVSDIQNGKIPVIVGTDGKVYNFWGKGYNPWGDSDLYCFVYLQWKWDSTNNKSYLEVYMICGLSSNMFYFSPKQTVG